MSAHTWLIQQASEQDPQQKAVVWSYNPRWKRWRTPNQTSHVSCKEQSPLFALRTTESFLSSNWHRAEVPDPSVNEKHSSLLQHAHFRDMPAGVGVGVFRAVGSRWAPPACNSAGRYENALLTCCSWVDSDGAEQETQRSAFLWTDFSVT